jgi:hypothetical protein
VKEAECSCRGLVIQLFSYQRIYMLGQKINIALRQIIEGFPLGKNHTDEFVFRSISAFDVEKMITVKKSCSQVANRIVFDGFWIGKLRAVIGQITGNNFVKASLPSN